MTRDATRQDRIDAEAADWLAAIDCGSADRQAFEQWRARDPAHALAFIRVSQVGRDLDSLRETGLSERSAPAGPEPAGPDRDRRGLLKLGVAGLVVAAVGGLGWTFAAAAREAETAVGERRRIVVANGIAIELNTDSHVAWRRTDPGYEIDLLRGEVMVERQAGSAPCALRCGGSQVELAAGGRLNARATPRGVDLSVLEGDASLSTSASAAPVHVATLRKARIVGGAAPAVSTISPREASAVAAWQQGQLHFNGESLEDAVAEYNRYLPRPIAIADPSLRGIRLGGRFSATDPADFCRALKEIYGVQAHVEPAEIRLTRT